MTTTNKPQKFETQAEALRAVRFSGYRTFTDDFGTYAVLMGVGHRVRLVDAGADGWLWLAEGR